MASKLYGGFIHSFVDKERDKFICSICHLVLRGPHLTKCCGQHFCESCLNNWFSKYRKESCPHCRAEGKEFQHFLNKSLKREIDSLRIHCTNEEKGCQWIGELGSLKGHLESDNGCGYVEVECPNKCMVPSSTDESETPSFFEFACEMFGNPIQVKKIQRKYLTKHLEKDCHLRSYRCQYCGHKDTYYRITGKHPYKSERSKSHYVECLEFPLICPNKCGSNFIKKKNMKDHRSRCPLEPVGCPFEEIGCKEKLIRRQLEQHMSATQQQHLLMVMGAYKEMKKENRRIKDKLEEKLEDTQDELDDLKKRMDRKRKRTGDYYYYDSDSDSD